MAEDLGTGRTAPKPWRGDRRSGRIEAEANLLLGAAEATPDITLAELREKFLAERGVWPESVRSSVCEALRRLTFQVRHRLSPEPPWERDTATSALRRDAACAA
jgi:hypothetical protein